MDHPTHDALRRRLLAGTALGAGSLVLPGALREALAQTPLVVGVIYVGPRGDFGYNQAQAQAAAAIKKLPGVKVVEEENVPETAAVQKTMEAMINQDKASLIFPTSFGYFDPHMLKMAEKYPKVRFAHCGGMWTEGKHPKNTGSYFGYIDECQFLAGVVAGYTSKTKKLGFIAAKPIPQVLRNINAFTMGARSVDPSITTQVIFTGDWSIPVKEAEAEETTAPSATPTAAPAAESTQTTTAPAVSESRSEAAAEPTPAAKVVTAAAAEDTDTDRAPNVSSVAPASDGVAASVAGTSTSVLRKSCSSASQSLFSNSKKSVRTIEVS